VDTFGRDDLVEAAAELLVPVMDVRPDGFCSVVEVESQVSRLLDHPSSLGVGRATGNADSPGGEFDEYQHGRSCSSPTKTARYGTQQITKGRAVLDRALALHGRRRRDGGAAARRLARSTITSADLFFLPTSRFPAATKADSDRYRS